ncbi:hypothetical protein GCM10010911_51750 [Paenibacillus nasutitermitis]|uniref:Uncharacterized protein n=1 Tax=Paenibacillus nasutitermitis TaxID=1652958 RepID=A0A916ZCG0_9BACL|nr:hypothetical protein GCM10010911_51750 [Paenibacillus nasutitermitis]
MGESDRSQQRQRTDVRMCCGKSRRISAAQTESGNSDPAPVNLIEAAQQVQGGSGVIQAAAYREVAEIAFTLPEPAIIEADNREARMRKAGCQLHMHIMRACRRIREARNKEDARQGMEGVPAGVREMDPAG